MWSDHLEDRLLRDVEALSAIVSTAREMALAAMDEGPGPCGGARDFRRVAIECPTRLGLEFSQNVSIPVIACLASVGGGGTSHIRGRLLEYCTVQACHASSTAALQAVPGTASTVAHWQTGATTVAEAQLGMCRAIMFQASQLTQGSGGAAGSAYSSASGWPAYHGYH